LLSWNCALLSSFLTKFGALQNIVKKREKLEEMDFKKD
jgi:hypothetical protein